jgi:plasmid stabilization system protein ParE
VKVRLTDRALDDLKSIADWIGADNGARDLNFLLEQE